MNRVHGFSKHPLFHTWRRMLGRCNNLNDTHYQSYGERGITVCERWKNPELFAEDMYPTYVKGLTLDRSNNNLGYSPENCKWSTKVEQANNRRDNNIVTYKGKKYTITQIARLKGIPPTTLFSRKKAGWNNKEIVEGKI